MNVERLRQFCKIELDYPVEARGGEPNRNIEQKAQPHFTNPLRPLGIEIDTQRLKSILTLPTAFYHMSFLFFFRISFRKHPNLVLRAHVPSRPLSGSRHIAYEPQHSLIP